MDDDYFETVEYIQQFIDEDQVQDGDELIQLELKSYDNISGPSQQVDEETDFLSFEEHQENEEESIQTNENLTCGSCEFATNTKNCLERHTEIFHPSENRHKCHSCDFSSNSEEQLKTHTDSAHPNSNPIECPGCLLTHTEFIFMLTNEERLKEFLREHGVIDLANEMNCPKCEKPCVYYPDYSKFMCNNTIQVRYRRKRKKCGFVKYVKNKTFFSGSPKSVAEICRFVSYWLINTKQEDLEDEINWSSNTIVHWTRFCREVCLVYFTQNNQRLGGPGKTVNIDEAKFGKSKYSSSRIKDGQWIFGGVERDSNKSFMVPVENRSRDTLLEVITEWVLPGTNIVSDCWESLDCLSHGGFQKLILDHRLKFTDPKSEPHNQNRDSFWREIQNHIPKYGRRSEYFPYYLAEFKFKKSFRRKERFHEFFKYVSLVYSTNSS